MSDDRDQSSPDDQRPTRKADARPASTRADARVEPDRRQQDRFPNHDRYEFREVLGKGGQGVVYRARQPGTKRMIALKRPVAGSFTSSSSRLRFEREIESAAALSNPPIVTT